MRRGRFTAPNPLYFDFAPATGQPGIRSRTGLTNRPRTAIGRAATSPASRPRSVLKLDIGKLIVPLHPHTVCVPYATILY